MKELNRKTFITIFLILSTFLISYLTFYNIRNYKKEYENIDRNLKFIEDRKEKREPDNFNNKMEPREFDNMMIMDYEVYTVVLNNNSIDRIISHGNSTEDFDIQSIASDIVNNKEKNIKIGNLYNNKYSYNYTSDNIVIINTKNINKKLQSLLIESILILIIVEIIIYLISKLITRWITKPALDSFNKQKDFIADASHELKTPLAVIMASSDELKSDKKNEKYIDNIKFESERMNKLISSLLDLSKLENGISKSTYKEENISKIIEKICLTFEAIAFEQNLKISTNIEDNIMFKCSKEEIEKLISIILDNAIKHSYQDTTIHINVKRIKNNIDIEIINKGDPINPGDEEKIFERFYRADKSRNRNNNRYGLGLSIAKNIVINHNGIIKAYSKNNKTTFKILLKK